MAHISSTTSAAASKSNAFAKRIIFESDNLTLKRGTGIATYARNLASVAKSAGYSTGALFGTRAPMMEKDPVINEIELFDSERPAKFNARAWMRRMAIYLVRDPAGVRPVQLRRDGIVIDPGSSLFTGDVDETYTLDDMSERARRHFQRYGRLLPVRFANSPDIFHTTHPIPLKAVDGATICTIHDIVPLRLPYTTLDNKRYFYKSLKAIVRKADHIVTVSESSRTDLITYFKIDERRVTNTYQSANLPESLIDRPVDVVANELRVHYGLDYGEYFLFAGAIEPKKNVSRMIEAYVGSGTKRPLILAGALGWQYEDDVKSINHESFLSYKMEGSQITPERRVRHLSYVSRARLVALMQGARALLFPSLYEGFGLPVLEAMQLGAPVMTSNISSLPEVAGDAALLVDPYDVGAMAQAIRRLDGDGDLRAELSARGLAQALKFTPENHARRIEAVYRSVTG